MESALPYGWFWKPAGPLTGVHTTGTSCEGQKAYSSGVNQGLQPAGGC